MPDAHEPNPQTRGREPPAPRPQFRRAGLARPAKPSDDRPEAAVCEAVFRYQLQQPWVDAPQPPRYYLALQGRDPGEALLRQLSAVTPGVQPFSHCRVTARDGVVDRATGARGVILQVARLTWVHAAAADVVGGYYLTHRHAAGLRYHVEQDGPHWAVTTVHLLWRV
jgi:hypothetical protein